MWIYWQWRIWSRLMWSLNGTNGAAKRWVFSGPTSYAMESYGLYREKKAASLQDVKTNCGKGVQESKQSPVWFETTGPVKSGELALLTLYVPIESWVGLYRKEERRTKEKTATMSLKIIPNVEHVQKLTYSGFSARFEQQRRYFLLNECYEDAEC